MDPKNLRAQCLACFVLPAAALGAFGSPGARTAAAAAALILLCVWAGLNRMYVRALNGRNRSLRRADGDRTVRRVVLAGEAVIFCTFVSHYVGLTTLPDLVESVLLWTGLAGFAMSASTLIDWFHFKAIRDGVRSNPPCVISKAPASETRWKDLTQHWLWQRWWTVFACLVGILFPIVDAVGWVTEGLDVGTDGIAVKDLAPIALLVGPLVAAVGVAVRLPVVRGLYDAFPFMFGSLEFRIGDIVEVDSETLALVYDVALDHGYTLVSPPGVEIRVPLRDVSARLSRPPRPAPDLKCTAALCRSFDHRRDCDAGDRRVLPGRTKATPKEPRVVSPPRFLA